MLNGFVACLALDLAGPRGIIFDFTGGFRDRDGLRRPSLDDQVLGIREAIESLEACSPFAIFVPSWFARRKAGETLVQAFLPFWDLTYVIDLSGCYIPGHGTTTLLLVGRAQPPGAPGVRVLACIRGEPASPPEPELGLVWRSVLDHVHRPGTGNEFVRCADVPRDALRAHPWSFEELVSCAR